MSGVHFPFRHKGSVCSYVYDVIYIDLQSSGLISLMEILLVQAVPGLKGKVYEYVARNVRAAFLVFILGVLHCGSSHVNSLKSNQTVCLLMSMCGIRV